LRRFVVKLSSSSLVILVLALACAAAPRATAGGPAAGSVLAEYPDLDRRISYAAPKVALGELVAKVAAETGVPLSAAATVADEPVAVAVTNVPARELLERLAALLGYRWNRAPKTGGAGAPGSEVLIEIGQDAAGRAQEEALRQAACAEAEQRFQEEVRRYVEAAALSPEQVHAALQEVQRRRKELTKMTPAQRAALFRSPQEWERIRRAALIQRIASPLTRAMASLLGRLTPAQWASLRSEGALDFSSEPVTGEYPLPADLASAFRGNPPRRLSPNPATGNDRSRGARIDPGKRLPPAELVRRDPWIAATGYRVIVRMDVGRLASSGGLALLLRVAPLTSPTAAEPLSADARRTSSLLLEVDALDAGPRAVDESNGARGATPIGLPLGDRKRFQTRVRPHLDPAAAGNSPSWRLADLMPDLARTYGVQIISDSYWSSPIALDGQPLPADPVTLPTLLDRFTAGGHTWECDGKWLRLRSRTWYFDRQREIPLRATREWKAMTDAQGALPLDAYTRLAGGLSTAQLRTLGAVVEQLNLPQDLLALPAAHSLLQLYATLAPVQRQTLWEGKPLSVAEMTSRQRELWTETVRDRSRRPGAAIGLPDRSWTGGTLSARSSPYLRVAERRGDSTTYRAELPTDTTRQQALPPSTQEPGSRPRPAADGGSAFPRSRSEETMAQSRPETVTRHPVTQLVFTLRAGTERSIVVALTTSPP
jgi:hypothetical protein